MTGALLIAVYVLWRSREQLAVKIDIVIEKKDAISADKDKQILTMIEHVTSSLTLQVETNREMRKSLEDSIRVKTEILAQSKELKMSIDHLGASLEGLPCVMSGDLRMRK